MPEASQFIVEWYRVEQLRQVGRVWAVGASMLSAGVLVLAVAQANQVDLQATALLPLVLAGVLLTIAGPLYAVIAFQRVLGDERFVALRSDGVLYSDGVAETLVRWEDLEDACCEDAETAVVLRIAGAEPLVLNARFGGIGAVELAARIKAVQRKALMNILTP
jgi:hypothetical protein